MTFETTDFKKKPDGFESDRESLHYLTPNKSLTSLSEYSSSEEELGATTNQPLIHNDAVSLQLQQYQGDMATPDLSQVLIIYTGGTIGMKNLKNQGYATVPNYLTETLAGMSRFHDHQFVKNHHRISLKPIMDRTEDDDNSDKNKVIVKDCKTGEIVEFFQRSLITPISLYGKRIRYSVFEYEPLLDSCNMSSDDWVRIATDIELNYQSYDAFIILHGTDTMAYTASALSFLLENLGKTIILTGSQVPLSEVRNDAVENLLGALTIAGHYVLPEVTLFFNNKLFHVNWAEVVRPFAIAKFKAHKNLNRNVSSLRLFPGITETTVKALLAPPIEGVILETYGAGNIPDTRDDIMNALGEASGRGVVIVNCTQCKKGFVSDIYATGKALSRVGVVSGNDLTPECALVKLSYLLSENGNGTKISPETVRNLMTKNLRGELTILSPRPRFTFHNRTHKIIQNMISSDLKKNSTSDLALTINVQEKVLMEKTLYPILLCSAAGTDDLDGMLLLWESYEGLLLNCVDYDGRTPLHIACSCGHQRIVDFLLHHGASVHMRDRFGHTPLFEAARNKNKHIIKLLREAGAHFNDAEIDDVMFQALSAASKNDVELLRHFVDSGMEINRTGFDRRTALHHAVAEGSLDTVQYLLLLPELNIETKDRWGRKPIDDAEMNLGRMWGRDCDREKQFREIVRLLREKSVQNVFIDNGIIILVNGDGKSNINNNNIDAG
ncbi:6707_t:CDS:10 [Entrophospora sp. SA101]|nr:6707_t:CDS:10 [Entrophospora sp. SA101]